MRTTIFAVCLLAFSVKDVQKNITKIEAHANEALLNIAKIEVRANSALPNITKIVVRKFLAREK